MRIDQLTLKNFRAFKEQAFHFHPEFNILIGENGAGKTTVLEALVIETSPWISGISGYDGREISVNEVRVESTGNGENANFEPQYPVEILSHGNIPEHQDLPWIRSLHSPSRLYEEDLGLPALIETSKKYKLAVQKGYPWTLPIIVYYGAARLWQQPGNDEDRRITNQYELSRLEGYKDAIDGRASARELTKWLAYQDYAAYQERKRSVSYNLVLYAMQEMLEGATEVTFHPRRLEIVVGFENGQQVPFGHLSDGQRSMLALAGDIAMRMARLNPHLGENALKETPGIVLIDELDLHLHPRWQRHIVKDLRRLFPRVQFFATTHSPQIISEVEPECLTILKRCDGELIVEKPSQSFGLDANWVLQSLMHVPSRSPLVTAAIERIDDAIEAGDLKLAKSALNKYRELIGGDSPDSVGYESSITALEALFEDALDSKAAA